MAKIMIDKNGAEIDVEGLPDDLLSELTCARDKLEEQIISLFSANGDPLTLDQILVGLYRQHGVLKKRRFMRNKLYRMSEVDAVEGRKGIYQIHAALIDATK